MIDPQPTSAITPAFFEGCLTLISIGIAFALPRFASEAFRSTERLLTSLARQRSFSVIVVTATAFLVRIALLPLSPIPLPLSPDDFSFLLSGDTFAHGRLANPTPVMWTHFESIHITMVPTYTSMYFPAQGLALAAGKVITGHAWFGLLCVTALMCGAITWMLQAWLPPGWALFGGFLAIARLGLFSYWINTYTGGASIAALAGALVLGSFPRLMRTVRLRDGLLLATGIGILIMSRPYEGLLLCLPVAFVLAHWFLGSSSSSRRHILRQAILPMALVVAAFAWMGYYDYRAFGNPLTPPYKLDRAQYAVEPYWMWQAPLPEPVYRHKVIRDFYVKTELPAVTDFRTTSGFFSKNLFKPIYFLQFFSGIVLLPSLFLIGRAFRDKRIRFLLIATAVLAAGMFLEIVLLPHYIAPFTAAFYAIGLQCMRHLRLCRPEGKPVGLTMVRLLAVVCFLLIPIRAFASQLHLELANYPSSAWTANWIGPGPLGAPRAELLKSLEARPGNQLVIVRYASNHNPVFEWVYNDADIENSKVIWAREMDAPNNRDLINHYKDRTVWLVEPDSTPVKLSPYPLSENATPKQSLTTH